MTKFIYHNSVALPASYLVAYTMKKINQNFIHTVFSKLFPNQSFALNDRPYITFNEIFF